MAAAAASIAVLVFGFGSTAVAAGNLSSLINDVATPVRSVVKPITAQVLPPPPDSASVPSLGLQPAPKPPTASPAPVQSPSDPADGPTTLPAADPPPPTELPSTGGAPPSAPTNLSAPTDAPKAALDAARSGGGANPPPPDAVRRPQVESFVEKAPGKSPTVGPLEVDLAAATTNPSSSPLSQWLPSDPPLPIAVFWIVMAMGLAFVSFLIRRELGLAGAPRRPKI